MKNFIKSITDTGAKKIGAAILCGALIVSMGTGMAFAATQPIDNNSGKKTSDDMVIKADDSIRIVAGSGDGMKISFNEGKIWQPYIESEAQNTWGKLEPYTAAEYEQEVEKIKASIPVAVAAGEITQEEADNLLAQMNDNLEKLKAGKIVLYKPIEGPAWIDEYGEVQGSIIGVTRSSLEIKTDNGKKYNAVIDVNGKERFLGSYDTHEELMAAAKQYLADEVKAGQIAQEEANKLLAQMSSQVK